MKAYDWQVLTKRATIAGDGSATSFDLPSDYDRMALKTNLASSASNIDLVKATDLDQWDYFQNHMSTTVPGYWMILGGQIQITPAPGTGWFIPTTTSAATSLQATKRRFPPTPTRWWCLKSDC
jgi:hypothetical protein